jgi:fatty acid desaturase
MITMSGLSEEGRLKLTAGLRGLQGISPWPGVLQLAVRLPIQVVMWSMAWSAWVSHHQLMFIVLGLIAAVSFASFISLTHDALHHRLTGFSRIDEIIGRLISWPIAWPIAAYKYVHLKHHRLNGIDLSDPERISPQGADWHGSAWRRKILCNQLWIAMFVLGAAGLAHKLLAAVARNWSDQVVRRAIIGDAIGIGVTIVCLGGMAYWAQGLHGVLGFSILWVIHERIVGITHQFRTHMEHYGLWGKRNSFIDTQYTSARTIRTNAFGRFYFNNLNRHAEHHIAPAIPFYKLEKAHTLIAQAYRNEGFISVETCGYFSALCEVLNLMRTNYSVDGVIAQRLQKEVR